MKKRKSSTFYTDGACSGNTGIGGWAYVELVPTEDGFKTISESGGKENTTNNIMELTAMYKALVKAYKDGVTQVTIYSDSAYVVNAITKGWLLNWYTNGWETKEGNPVKNKIIWEKVYKLIYVKGLSVTLNHVKGHNGDVLNELADRLAVKAKQEVMEG